MTGFSHTATAVPHLRHAATSPRARHGFFGAAGGVSSGVYASLNCGFGSDDDTALGPGTASLPVPNWALPSAGWQLSIRFMAASGDCREHAGPDRSDAGPHGAALVQTGLSHHARTGTDHPDGLPAVASC